MKFKLTVDQLETLKAVEVRKAPSDSIIHSHSNWTRQQVVGSEIKWKPVDKTAAMIIAKAPWWAHLKEVEYGRTNYKDSGEKSSSSFSKFNNGGRAKEQKSHVAFYRHIENKTKSRKRYLKQKLRRFNRDAYKTTETSRVAEKTGDNTKECEETQITESYQHEKQAAKPGCLSLEEVRSIFE